MEPTPELAVAPKKPTMWESLFGPSTPASAPAPAPAPALGPAPASVGGRRKRRSTQKVGKRKSNKTGRRHRVKKHSRK